jgi:hypothetical protein
MHVQYIIEVKDEVREGPKGQGSLSPKKCSNILSQDHKELKDAERCFLDVPNTKIHTTHPYLRLLHTIH